MGPKGVQPSCGGVVARVSGAWGRQRSIAGLGVLRGRAAAGRMGCCVVQVEAPSPAAWAVRRAYGLPRPTSPLRRPETGLRTLREWAVSGRTGRCAAARWGVFADPWDASADPWDGIAIPWGVSTIPWDVSSRPMACFVRKMRTFAPRIAISTTQNATKRRGGAFRRPAPAGQKAVCPLYLGRAGMSQFFGKLPLAPPRAVPLRAALPRPVRRPSPCCGGACRWRVPFFNARGPYYLWKMPNFASS